MYYLQSYCLELNSDEFLNRDAKFHIEKQCFHTKAQMVKLLNSHLKMGQK
ncbi:hypothetical protein NEOC95_000533 [Neochlamydia sp. AcF95]|nr:hypothetical protein [Neochlamydia sp. AcF95]